MADVKAKISLDSSEFTHGIEQAVAALNNFGVSLGTLSAAGFIALAKQGIELAHDIENLSRKTGASVEDIQRFGFAAKETGSSVDVFSTALIKLSRNSAAVKNFLNGVGDSFTTIDEGGEIVSLSGNKAAKALSQLGIDAKSFVAASPTQQFIALGDALKAAGDSGLPAVFDLLGKNAGQLLPMLKMNREELEKLLNVSVISASSIENLSETSKKTGRMFHELKTLGVEALDSIAYAAKGIGHSFDLLMPGLGEGLKKIEDETQIVPPITAGEIKIGEPAAPVREITPREEALSKQGEELRDRIKLIGMSSEEEIKFLDEKRNALALSLTENKNSEQALDTANQVLAVELQIAAVKERIKNQAEASQKQEEKAIENYKTQLEDIAFKGMMIGKSKEEQRNLVGKEMNLFSEIALRLSKEPSTPKNREEIRKNTLEAERMHNQFLELSNEIEKEKKENAPRAQTPVEADQFARMGLFSGNRTGGLVGFMQKTSDHTRMMMEQLKAGIKITNLQQGAYAQ